MAQIRGCDLRSVRFPSKTKLTGSKRSAEHVVKGIRRMTRRHFSSEDKIRIVPDGLRCEDSIAELCRKEWIAQTLYYIWSKDFLEAGKRQLAGDTAQTATGGEVQDLRGHGGGRQPDAGEPPAQKGMIQ